MHPLSRAKYELMSQPQEKSRENEKVARAAGVVGLATMLSRVFGFIRDMVVAGFFGAGLVPTPSSLPFGSPTSCAASWRKAP